MKAFWDERYTNNEMVYGYKPNRFLEDQLEELPLGKILLPAEGEGRNAIFAAKLGWQVHAFDFS
ncbi:MAG: SAM-dependent methyltransferase, partial [Bacteroidia bacterium]